MSEALIDPVVMADTEAPTELLSRRHQMFPLLTECEMGRIRRFGEVQHYGRGDYLFHAGRPSPGMFVVITGSVAITQRDGLGHVVPIVHQGPRQFLAEVGTLSGRPSLVDGQATEPVEALLVSPSQLRALIIAEADLGERLVRALILRRVSVGVQIALSVLLLAAAGLFLRTVGNLRAEDLGFRPDHLVEFTVDPPRSVCCLW